MQEAQQEVGPQEHPCSAAPAEQAAALPQACGK